MIRPTTPTTSPVPLLTLFFLSDFARPFLLDPDIFLCPDLISFPVRNLSFRAAAHFVSSYSLDSFLHR